jgi:hypothetical protein
MNEVSTPAPATNASEQLQKADEAHNHALQTLGEVAAGTPHEVHTDASGVVLRKREVEAVANGETDAK